MATYKIDNTIVEGETLFADEINIHYIYQSLIGNNAIVVGLQEYDLPMRHSIFKDKENNIWITRAVNDRRYINLGFTKIE